MVLKSPFGYVNMQVKMLGSALDIFRDYCYGCHSNVDWNDNCKECPAGNFIEHCKAYMRRVPGWISSNEWRKKIGLPPYSYWGQKHYDLCIILSKEIDLLVCEPLSFLDFGIKEPHNLAKLFYRYEQLDFYFTKEFRSSLRKLSKIKIG